jgi:hypothetical protein
VFCGLSLELIVHFYYTPRNEVVGGYTVFTITKIYPLLPTSVQPISITKPLLIVSTKNERHPPLFTGKLLMLSLSFSCSHLTFFVTTCTCTCTCTFCKLIIFLHVPGNYNIPACTYVSTVMFVIVHVIILYIYIYIYIIRAIVCKLIFFLDIQFLITPLVS